MFRQLLVRPTRTACTRVRWQHMGAISPELKLNQYTKNDTFTEDYETNIAHFRPMEVPIRTCGTLFQKWKVQRRYWRVPESDLHFNVEYLDTCDGQSKNDPVVLTLPGSPGSHKDFTELTTHLYNHGARVILPSFPDVRTYKWGRFRHTPEEKCEYIKDFMQAIDVPKVDLLICHSSSLFPGLLLCLENQRPKIGSVAFLNPTAFENPRVMDPLPVVHLFSRAFEFPIGYQIATSLGKLIVNTKSQLKGGSHMEHFLSAFTLISANVPQRVGEFKELVRRKFPILLAFSENDKLIGKRALYKMASLMSDQQDIHRYDKDGELVKSGSCDWNSRVLVFECGTHFVFKKHPNVVSHEVNSFLKQHLHRP